MAVAEGEKASGDKPQQTSFFEKRTLKDLYNEIRNTYLGDERTWIIGYSGGKDSTAALQLVWYALSEL
ncbi:MAG: hypothetical protein ACREBU_22190, partial [Nitrososphaera sp.]